MPKILWMGLIIFIATLTGCATVAPKNTQTPTKLAVQPSWQDRAQALGQLQRWQLKGKIAIQTSKDSGSASVDWSQDHGRYVVSLLGPLGTNGLKLTGKPGKVTLTTAEGKQFTATTPEGLLAKQWGWDLPVSNLNYWVRGLPAPGSVSNTQFDASHRITSLTQQGWNVQFPSYTNEGKFDLPEKVFIYSPSLKTKIIIYHWSLGG